MIRIRSSEITPEHLYRARRRFIKGAGVAALGAILAACGVRPSTGLGEPTGSPATGSSATEPATDESATATPVPPTPVVPGTVNAQSDELGNPLTPFKSVTSYVNFYEFSPRKDQVVPLVEGFKANPWTVHVGGLVHRPRTFDLDDLRKFELEERIYRLRCVEAWSMVIPWIGFPLARLLEAVEPLSKARYVRFETLYDPEQMPGQRSAFFEWPYVEGLRIDEAMHDLTILAMGLYGKDLLPQNGAPVRLVVPWKYGFKSIKSIVKIDLVEEQPVSLWMAANPSEYGFYANVNPDVPHPRWSQATERRIGETGRFETLLFNGYAEEVADLYPDLDNRRWFY